MVKKDIFSETKIRKKVWHISSSLTCNHVFEILNLDAKFSHFCAAWCSLFSKEDDIVNLCRLACLSTEEDHKPQIEFAGITSSKVTSDNTNVDSFPCENDAKCCYIQVSFLIQTNFKYVIGCVYFSTVFMRNLKHHGVQDWWVLWLQHGPVRK